MNSDTQEKFMYLFERVGEPLYFGPRGKDNVLYMVPMDGMDKHTQDASIGFRNDFGKVKTKNVTIKPPKQMPNLSGINRLCPKSGIFSYFNENHLEGATQLKNILKGQSNLDDLLSTASMCRDSEMINPKLWIYAFAATTLERKDMKGFRLPAYWEIAPDVFITGSTIRLAQQQASMPANDRKVIEIGLDFAGTDANPENRLAYFREDMGVNSHHWHWHLIYPNNVTKENNKQDRRGELFYYMHHSMLARYNAERLANGLGKVQKIEFDERDVLPEGYFPKLVDTNSGLNWGGRQENTKFSSIDRQDLTSSNQVQIPDLKIWKDRIYEAIDTGFAMGADGLRYPLTTDLLGNMVEAAPNLTPHSRYYGNLHNLGHNVLAFLHDPKNRHKETGGVMMDTTTAMRDPAFYRWHTFVDELFNKYKETKVPYTKDELSWNVISVKEVSVKTENVQELNLLTTYWMKSHVDLSRGLDLRRDKMRNAGPIWARLTHLNHDDFKYIIKVNNGGRISVDGTIRIFMAPRMNEQGRRFNITQQRHLFFEMDKFVQHLKPGDNIIERSSLESSVTIPWSQSFRQLEREMNNPDAVKSVCGCGWPQHLLLPRGTSGGMVFDLFVMITNYQIDKVERRTLAPSESQKQGCKEAMSFCGILDDKYPDKQEMGFPFDRRILPVENQQITLDTFVKDLSNVKTIQVKIVNKDLTVINESDGATVEAPVVVANPSRPGSPTSVKPPPPVIRPVTYPKSTTPPVQRPQQPQWPQRPQQSQRPQQPQWPQRPQQPYGNRPPPQYIPTGSNLGSFSPPQSPPHSPQPWGGRWTVPNSGRGRSSNGSPGRESRESSPNGWTWM